MQAAEYREIWGYATRIGAIVITKDEDFSTRVAMDPAGPAIVWIRFGNTSRQELLHRIQPLLPSIEVALAGGEKLIEIV